MRSSEANASAAPKKKGRCMCNGLFMFGAQERTRTSTELPASTDRKSTRLNSSHLVISYAVFCLKKKKTSFCLNCCSQPALLQIFRQTPLYTQNLLTCTITQPCEH